MRAKAKSQKLVSRAVKEAGFKNIKEAKQALATGATKSCSTKSCSTKAAVTTECAGATSKPARTESSFMREVRHIVDASMTDVETYRALSNLLNSYALTRVVAATSPTGGYAFSYSYTR